MNRKTLLALVTLATAAVAAAPSGARAANITFLNFGGDVDLTTPSPKEFSFNPSTGLSAGPGAAGDGSFYSPGLLASITGGLPGVAPGSVPGATSNTLLSDLSFSLSGFQATGSATVNPTSISQNLSSGTFSVFYHNPSDGTNHANDLILLTGSASSALLTEKSTGTASVLSGPVTYTGGLLKDELAPAHLLTTGSFAFTLTLPRSAFGTTTVNGNTRLASFNADGTATFGATAAPVVPTPAAALTGVTLLSLLGLSRLKQHRADHA